LEIVIPSLVPKAVQSLPSGLPISIDAAEEIHSGSKFSGINCTVLSWDGGSKNRDDFFGDPVWLFPLSIHPLVPLNEMFRLIPVSINNQNKFLE
jgi:hypothetical protein